LTGPSTTAYFCNQDIKPAELGFGAGVEFGNSYNEINRNKAAQLEREESKTEVGGGPLDATCLAEEDKAETIRGAGHLREG